MNRAVLAIRSAGFFTLCQASLYLLLGVLRANRVVDLPDAVLQWGGAPGAFLGTAWLGAPDSTARVEQSLGVGRDLVLALAFLVNCVAWLVVVFGWNHMGPGQKPAPKKESGK